MRIPDVGVARGYVLRSLVAVSGEERLRSSDEYRRRDAADTAIATIFGGGCDPES